MNTDAITILDCVEMHEMLGKSTVINDGRVVGFTEDGKYEYNA